MNPERPDFPGSLAWILLFCVFFSILFTATWIRTQCTGLHFRISRIQEEKNRLISQKQHLEIEQARLRSPERIRNLGANRLKLEMPKAENTIDLTGFLYEKTP